MNPAKVVIAVVWLFCVASFFVATESAAAGIGRLVFWVMGAAHIVECAIFLPRLRAAEGGLGGHVMQTLLFGFAHLRTLGASAADAPSPG